MNRFFERRDMVEHAEANKLRYSAELLHFISETASMPGHQLTLKPSFIQILLQNLNSDNGDVIEAH